MKKRILSLCTALLLIFALASPALAAAPESDPIIMIAGYTSTQLFANPDSDGRVQVWNPDFNQIALELVKELPGLLGGGAIYAVSGWEKMIVDAFARAADRALGKFTMNADGTRAHDVGPWPGGAKDFSLAVIRSKYDKDHLLPNGAQNLMQLSSFCKRFEQQVGTENIFIFQYEWRDPTLMTVEKLRAFIQEVKQLTGSRKVRIFGSSYGGQITGAYLHDYAAKGDVSRVVMEFPALGGSSMIPAMLTGEGFGVQAEAFTRFVQSYMDTETKLDPILKGLDLSKLYPLVTALLQGGIKPVAVTWGSLWDLVPANQYEATKKAVLGPGEHYAWEKYCDRMHREIMPNIGKTLKNAQKVHGIEIRIVANTGSPHLVGPNTINSDGLLDVQYTTGAKALPLGGHGIKRSNTNCANAKHAHVSPGQDIDASAAWLPENTWFVQGQYHGASYLDPYALDLESALMLDPDLDTVRDDPAFPQFGLCRQPSECIAAGFDGKALKIDNLSKERGVKLLSLRADGLAFESLPGRKLKPGESASIACTKSKAGGALTAVTVRYYEYNGIIPILRTKAFDFTL